MQNAKPSLKEGWIHGWVTLLLTYASLIHILFKVLFPFPYSCIPKSPLVSVEAEWCNKITLYLNFWPRKWNSKHDLELTFFHIGEAPGPKQTGKLFGVIFFNNFITQYALLKWSLNHPAKAKCNKSLIKHLMMGICIGSSYIKKL